MTQRVEELKARGVDQIHWQWRERRLKLGLTIGQAAAKLGWCSEYYLRLETGSQKMTDTTRRRLTKFYDEAEHRCPLCGRS